MDNLWIVKNLGSYSQVIHSGIYTTLSYPQLVHSVMHSLYTLKVKLHTGYPQLVLSYPHVIQSSIVDTVIPLYTTVDTVPDQHCVGCDCVVKCE